MMILEDEDSKIRRNLVLVSGAILCSSWLGIQLTVFLEKLLPAGTQVPDNWKFWVVELALLIYLGIRYRFSDEGSKYVITAKEELSTIRRHRATDFAQSEANRFTKTGIESPIFQGEMSGLLSDWNDGGAKGVAGPRPKMVLTLIEQTDSPWSFTVGVSAFWETAGGGSTSTSGNTLKVQIKGGVRRRIEFASCLHLWVYTESSIRYLVPVLLGLLAVLMVVANVASNYCGLLER